jgi:hypothetical protein
MRDQYAGDISDFFKFSFLRALVSGTKLKLGVGWYYVDSDDGRGDGKHREYLQQNAFRTLDPKLFDQLSNLSERSVDALQQTKIWNENTIFHNSAIPRSSGKASREAWTENMVGALLRSDIIFIDPDNGIKWNDNPSPKHALKCEVETLAINERPLIFIKFPGMNKKHADQILEIHGQFRSFHPITITTYTSVPTTHGGKVPRSRWFTVLNPTSELDDRISQFSKTLNSMEDVSSSIHGNF